MFSGNANTPYDTYKFILDILDGMDDWVRVVDDNHSVIFMNRAMEESLQNEDFAGKKCYEQLGKNFSCDICTCKDSISTNKSCRKIEQFGERIYSVMSSPIASDGGKVQYCVEVLRDITKDKEMESKIIAQNQQLKNDLELAKKMQQNMLPWNKEYDQVKFEYIYKPCETLGGDFFNISRVDDDNIAFYIADVSGHGITASMLTVFLRSSIRKKIHSPAKTLKRLYKDFNDSDLNKELYITIFYCILNIKKMELTYTNAGHNCPPLIIGDNYVKKLDGSGIPISNWMEKPVYKDRVIKLTKEDRIFLYTDGIFNQLILDTDKIFDDLRFMDVLKNKNNKISVQLKDIYKYIEKQFIFNNDNLKDDITMALIEV